MDAQMLLFVALAAIGFASAVMVVTRRNPVHSALYLIVTFFTVAAIYVVLHAEFIAAVQVLVYAGGIMVLFLFVIMLVDVPGISPARRPRRVHVTISAVLTGLVLALMAHYFLVAAPSRSGEIASATGQAGNLETVSMALFRHYLLPFEVVSVLLMVALVGAVILARPKA